MKIIDRVISSLSLVSLVVLTPVVSMAKENEAGQEQNEMISQPDFSEMIVGYTNEGIPIVDDFSRNLAPSPRAVTAKVISPYGYFYSDVSLKDNTLLFSIPRGNTVEVLDANAANGVAYVKYSGVLGYIKKSNLQF